MAELTAQTHSHLGIGVRKKTELTKEMRSYGKAKFGQDAAIYYNCLGVGLEAIFVKSQKCPYHVNFHLDLDLEHTLYACSPGDHRAQNVYRPTDDGRRAIALG